MSLTRVLVSGLATSRYAGTARAIRLESITIRMSATNRHVLCMLSIKAWH